METFSALLAICAGNSPVSGEFPAQRPVTRSFDVFFDLRLNKPVSKQSYGWWLETLSRPLWRHCNVLCSQHPPYRMSHTEKEIVSFWWSVHHWLHWKLSKWQLLCSAVSGENFIKTTFLFQYIQLMPGLMPCKKYWKTSTKLLQMNFSSYLSPSSVDPVAFALDTYTKLLHGKLGLNAWGY